MNMLLTSIVRRRAGFFFIRTIFKYSNDVDFLRRRRSLNELQMFLYVSCFYLVELMSHDVKKNVAVFAQLCGLFCVLPRITAKKCQIPPPAQPIGPPQKWDLVVFFKFNCKVDI